MFILFILFFIIDVILFEFASFFFPGLTSNVELYSLSFIFLHGISVLLVLIFKGEQYKHILIAAFILRLLIMFADLYHWCPSLILHSGGDSEMFHYCALYNQNHIDQQNITNYTYFLTFLYSITHSSRIIAQYINCLFGIGIIIILKEIFQIYNLRHKAILLSLAITSFMPNFAMFSGILLREVWIEFFIALSLYFFLHWFKTANNLTAILSIVSVLLAAYMHSGVIVIIAGYAFAFITYNKNKGSMELSRESIVMSLLLALLFVLSMGKLSLFTTHFNNIESADIMTDQINVVSETGSAYLTWIHADNIFESVLFTPLKMLYFLYSPLPTNWRGLGDIIAFISDSSIYIYLSWIILKFRIINHSVRLLKKYLLIGFLISIFVFALGTTTAGTAMRHRAKLFPIILVMYAFSINERYETINYKDSIKKE